MNNWQIFYQNIKDPSWPDCPDVQDFHSLPNHIKHEIKTLHNCEFADIFYNIEIEDYIVPVLNPQDALQSQTSLRLDQKFAIGDISVYYANNLDGGGTGFGQNFSAVLRELYPSRKFENCLEWCAGPGFIGFRLLHDGICKNVTFFEGYLPAVQSLNKTISHLPGRFGSSTRVCHLEDVAKIDESCKFDLVVGNPPFYNHRTFANSYMSERTSFDWDWKTHQNFFANISRYLDDNGVILLIESSHGSSPNDFETYIKDNGMMINRSFAIKHIKDFWFLEVTKRR